MCHEQLIVLQNERGMGEVPNAIIEFIKWLHIILFKPADGSLPIFGDLEMGDRNPDCLKVGPVQRYLINHYLSPKFSHFQVIQVSLALIGYWYQQFHPHFFF
jgi:hypothetical protein